MRLETRDDLDDDNHDGGNCRNAPAGIDHYNDASVDRQVLRKRTRAADAVPNARARATQREG